MSLSQPRPKLAYIVSRFPYPLEKGDKLRAYYQLKELSKTHEIHLFALTEMAVDQRHIELLNEYCEAVHVFRLRKWMIVLQLFRCFFSTKPFQTAYFYDPLIDIQINRLLKKIKPEHIFCQLILAAEYVKDYHYCPKSLDYMDALSKGIERRIERAPFYSRWLFRSESRRLGQYERTIFSYFEYKLIISEQDRELIFHPERKTILCVPNGISESFFEPVMSSKKYDLVFVGNLSYAPNIEAVEFIDKLLSTSELTCLVSGANPSSTISRIAAKNKRITLQGWVDDIREAYCSGRIFIAPMMIGTGMQNKLLEAMALGIPCITTPLAGNAIHGKHEEHLLIAQDMDEFKRAIERLINDHELYKTISANASFFVKQQYSWSHANRIILEKCLNYSVA